MKNVWTPDVFVRELRERISRSERAAFFGALVIGFLTHSYAFFNKLYNYDELPSTPGGFIGAGNNRWFLEITGRVASRYLDGSWSLPFLSGMLTLLLVALSAFLIVRMFAVKSTVLSVLLGGFLASFPALTTLYFFMFLAPNYAVGIFLSVLGAYIAIRFPKKIVANILSVLCIACATGTYQAYFPNTVCLFMMSIILLCAFDKDRSWKEIFFLALRYVILLALGMVLYFVLNKVLLAYWNIDSALGAYQGLDTMGQITLAEMKNAIRLCYVSFWKLGFQGVYYLNNRVIAMKAIRVMVVLLVASAAVRIYLIKGEWVKKCFMVAGFLLFPVGLFLTYLMAPKAYYYSLMWYTVVFLFVFLAVWADCFYQNIVEDGKLQKWKIPACVVQWCSVIASVVVLIVYVWYGNGSYMAMEYTKMHDMSYFQTLVTQIKSLDGYTDELPVALIGNSIDDQTNGAGDLLGMTFALDGRAGSNVNGTAGLYLMAKYLGYTPYYCGYQELQEWVYREDVADMPCYPDDGSIQVIDGTIVVKFSQVEAE